MDETNTKPPIFYNFVTNRTSLSATPMSRYNFLVSAEKDHPVWRARWVLFSRLYVRRYNNMLHVCPAVFKDYLQEIGIVATALQRTRSNRPGFGRWVVFAALDGLTPVETLTEDCAPLIRANRDDCLGVILKLSAMYNCSVVNGISLEEAALLAEWLGIESVGRYVPLQIGE